MGQNLGPLNISSSYQALVQISGSQLTDGTGSLLSSLDVTVTSATSATSASYATNAGTANSATTATSASFATSASHATNSDLAITASYALSGLSAATASFAITAVSASHAVNSDLAVTASHALSSLSAATASLAISAVSASYATNAGSATTATSASHALNSDSAISSSYASTATTASHAIFAETAGGAVDTNAIYTASISDATVTFTKGDTSTFDITVNNVVNANSASVATNATSASYATTAASATSASYATNADSATSASLASLANQVKVSTASNSFLYQVPFVANDGNETVWVDSESTKLTYVPATNTLGGIDVLNATKIVATSVTASLNGNASTATSASHALIADDLVSGANINITSITASGAEFTNLLATSASIGFLQTVTGSATIIGDAYIILNTSDATRYAGIAVEDSGSATPNNYTASFNFDSLTNDWFYEYSGSDPTNFGVALFGPEYGTKGTPSYPTNNRLVKGDGGHHLNDSSITDDGSTVSMTAELDVTGGISASAGFLGNLTGNASTATSASYATTASYAENANIDTSAFATTGSNTFVGNQIITGSVRIAPFNNFYQDGNANGIIFEGFISGSGGLDSISSTQFNGDLVGTASFATSASHAATATTASFALNAPDPFPYTGNVGITGDINLTGSYNRLSGSFSGSAIDNITDVYTSSGAVNHVITLTQAEYNAISASADPNTLYYITDAASFATSASYAVSASYAATATSASYALTATSASFASTVADGITLNDPVVNGQMYGNVAALSIASNTASLDCSTANFFTLALVDGSDTHLTATNPTAGQTVNVRLTNGASGTGTVSFNTSIFKFPGGTATTGSAGANAVDVVSFVCFDDATLLANYIENLS